MSGASPSLTGMAGRRAAFFLGFVPVGRVADRIRELERMLVSATGRPEFVAGLVEVDQGWWGLVKRAFDVVFSVVVLVVFAPVWLVIVSAIKADDGGPVFFRQLRVGLDGRPFVLVKFRTMRMDAEACQAKLIAERGCSAVFFKVRGDSRVTRVGRVLRRFSLDEIPQFWNVLRGDMSVVGPRPQVAAEVAEYAPEHFRRLSVRPGITGLWQVSGRYLLSVEESLLLDLDYVDAFGPLIDARVLVRTVPAMVSARGETW